MSVEQAQAFVNRLAEDAQFRQQFVESPIEEHRAMLVEAGLGDIRLKHIAEVLPQSAGGEVSDEEFAAVTGGGYTTLGTLLGSWSATAVGAASASAAA